MRKKPIIVILLILLLAFGCSRTQNTVVLADHHEYVLTDEDTKTLKQLVGEIDTSNLLEEPILYETSVDIHFASGESVSFAGDEFYDKKNTYRIDTDYLVEKVLPQLINITDKYHIFGCLIGVGTDLRIMSSTLVDTSDSMTYQDSRDLGTLIASKLAFAELVEPKEFTALYKLTINDRYRSYNIDIGKDVVSVDDKYYDSHEVMDIVLSFIEYSKSSNNISFLEYYGGKILI